MAVGRPVGRCKVKGKTHGRSDLVGYDVDDDRMFGKRISTSEGESEGELAL